MNEVLKKEIEDFGSNSASHTLTDKTFSNEGYKTAIIRATRDMTARTLRPKDKVTGKLIDLLLDGPGDVTIEKYVGKKSFLKVISEYFESSVKDQTAFDTWHNNVCNDILLPAIRHFYTNGDKQNSEVCYGKAQKILNMTFKGCYCLQGAEERKEYFEHCHMALDSFILAWYKENKGNIRTEWSKLSEKEYIAIKDYIRTVEPDIDLFKDLTPFEKEFFIWRLEMMKVTVKEINKSYGGFVKDDYATEYLEAHGMLNELKMSKALLGMCDLKELAQDTDFIKSLEIIKDSDKKRETADYLLNKLQP